MTVKNRYTISIDRDLMSKFDNKIVTGEIKSGSRIKEIQNLIKQKLERVES